MLLLGPCLAFLFAEMGKTKGTADGMVRKYAVIGLVLLGGLIAVARALGQDSTWSIDSQHSMARLFLDSSGNSKAGVNVGAARASGVMVRRAGNSLPSDFAFTIYPLDKTAPLESSAQERGGENPVDNPNYSVIRFKSKRVVPLSGGSFRVAGDLTLTYVEPLASYGQGGAYSGAVYGPAVTESVTQPAVFEFHPVSGPRGIQNDIVEWSASSAVNGEEFPELLNAVSHTKCPTFVVNEKRGTPCNEGEGFSGPASTGTTIEVASGAEVHREMPSVGQDSAGEVRRETLPVATTHVPAQRTEPPHPGGGDETGLAANEVRMQLDLQLTRVDSRASVGSGQ
jgi:hypothetical protein